VLLPGLDGTGDLFAPFVAAARGTFELQVVRYDHAEDQSYERLAQSVAPQLRFDRDYVLVAESFGGPLALRLAAEAPKRLASLVLVASFVRSPLSLAQNLALPLAARALAHPPADAWAARRFMLGDDAPEALVTATLGALRSVPASVLRARLSTLASCDQASTYLHCMQPMFYLQAARDRLLGPHALQLLAYLRPGLVIETIDAPHLLLQHAPHAALEQLRRWLIDDKLHA
jgi:pimeloyl-[acyl-carrier protein] methyl ester esterase